MSNTTGIEQDYRSLTPQSAQLMQRAAHVMPGGNTRTASFYPPYPVVLEGGDGAWVWDVDDRRYVDLFCNGLSLIHGHNYPPVRAAIEQALTRGTAWAGASRDQIAFAELITRRLPAMERVRFTNSGSEAGMIAVHAARRHTGKPYVLKFVGAYHGSYPDLEAGLYGQGDLPGRALAANFNDLEHVERVLALHGQEIAAVMIEPVLVTGRVVAPQPEFLREVQRLAKRHQALVIVDDCLMLRLAVGGSTRKFDLQPDLVVLGNPIGCAAGLVTLRELTAERIATMDARRLELHNALAARAKDLGLEVELTGLGSVAGIAFAADPLRHEDNPAALGVGGLFHLACANAGVLLGPGGIMALSTVHDEQVMRAATNGLSAALEKIAAHLRI